MFSCRKKSRENAPLCCDGVESLICSPMLSNVTPETPCDKIDEPASSIVIEDDLRIGLQGWPVLSLGFSSGDITSANSSAVSSVKMLVSIFGFWKQQQYQCRKILYKIICNIYMVVWKMYWISVFGRKLFSLKCGLLKNPSLSKYFLARIYNKEIYIPYLLVFPTMRCYQQQNQHWAQLTARLRPWLYHR